MVPFLILVSSGGESLCELVPNEVREALPGENLCELVPSAAREVLPGEPDFKKVVFSLRDGLFF